MPVSRIILDRRLMLDWLEKPPAEGAVRTFYLPAGAPVPEAVPAELAGFAAGSKIGAVLFSGEERAWLALPPFPVKNAVASPRFEPGPLRGMLERDHVVGLVLVRLGAFAVGVCQGERLLTSKVGTGLVHGRHRQGGSSSNRFRRHREKQIETFLIRVCGHAREQLESRADSLDYMACGGAWTTILMLQKQCPFLARFSDRLLPPLLDIPDPRQRVLEQAITRVWSSVVLEWKAP